MSAKGDLYAALDLARDAATKDVRAAFRKKAKDAHPDTGGSAEKFGALKLAHDVLTDDKRRKTYDETGRIDEPQPDNRQAAAMQAVAAMLDTAIAQLAQHGGDPTSDDLVKGLRGMFDQAIGQSEQQLHILKLKKDKYFRVKGRFRRRKKTKQPNHIEMMIDAALAGIAMAENRHGMEIHALKDAQAMLDEFEYLFEQQQAVRYMTITMNRG